ncbi:class I SAM-dependent methyltransferase [Bizionia sediminis]|uniref:Class I SAM-dependent methyltransferase n=1 Tax=Bizionia sediminis TaxID=1737064 RepID=A0ABW5KPX9_9FLAO
MKESLDYYNQFDKKLINDYVTGNRRIISAIKRLSQFIPENSGSVLDIGCGIGWSSHEFAKAFPNSQVLAVDLSPVLIETAKKLFENQKNLFFRSYDLTEGLPKGKFNAIVMIDVYEHIPLSDRTDFHHALKNKLDVNGRVILACPSKYHQNFLKRYNPSGLQPIDEDVDFETIRTIAKDIDGEIILFEYQGIWNNYDYLYAVIELKPQYGDKTRKIKLDALDVEPKSSRVKRVNSKLDIFIEAENKDIIKTMNIRSILKRLKKKFNL